MKLTWLQRIAIRRILGREWVEPVEKFLSLFDSPGRAMASMGLTAGQDIRPGFVTIGDDGKVYQPKGWASSTVIDNRASISEDAPYGTDGQGRALPASDATTTRVSPDAMESISRQMGFGPIPSIQPIVDAQILASLEAKEADANRVFAGEMTLDEWRQKHEIAAEFIPIDPMYVGPDTKYVPSVAVGKVTDTSKITIGKPPENDEPPVKSNWGESKAEYAARLAAMPQQERERLLYGMWDDPEDAK